MVDDEEDILKLVRFNLVREGYQVFCTISGEEILKISAKIDATLIEQAIFNLLENAINYSPENGVVRISTLRKDKEVTINVQNHGIGISKEHLSRIFERFFRVDKARSRSMGGTGLGLTIVKHISQAHRGYAIVESTPEKGSTFSMHIPAK